MVATQAAREWSVQKLPISPHASQLALLIPSNPARGQSERVETTYLPGSLESSGLLCL